MDVWIISKNFLNIQQNECSLLITAHPRWSKPEAKDKVPVGERTHIGGEPEKLPFPMDCHIKEKRDGFLVLILLLTTFVFFGCCFFFKIFLM